MKQIIEAPDINVNKNNSLDDIAYEGAEIKLGGKTRRLKYNFTSMRVLLRKYGSLQKALKEFSKIEKSGGDITEDMLDVFTTMIYAGLVHEDKTLTFEQVDGMLNFRNVTKNIEAISEALANSLPETPETGDTDEKNPKTPVS